MLNLKEDLEYHIITLLRMQDFFEEDTVVPEALRTTLAALIADCIALANSIPD